MTISTYDIPKDIFSKLRITRMKQLTEIYPDTEIVYPNGYVKKCGHKKDNYFKGFIFGIHGDVFKRPEINSFVCVGWLNHDGPIEVYVYRVCKIEDNCIPTVWGEEINHFTMF